MEEKDSGIYYKNKNFKGIIGVAEIDITPPVGIYSRNWAAAHHDISAGNDGSLKAVCISLKSRQEDLPLLLISADLCVWRSSRVKDSILHSMQSKFGIPESHIVLCFTHTHASPVLSPEEEQKPGGDKIGPYIDFLTGQLILLCQESITRSSSAIITWQYGRCSLAAHRDLCLPELTDTLTGFNPKVEADDTLFVGRVFDLDRQTISGTIVNYACHPTTFAWQNELISADYVGHMRNTVEHFTASPTLFIQGSSGELAPKQQYTRDVEVVRKNGRQLAFAVLSTLEEMLPPDQEMYFKEKIVSGADLALWDYRATDFNATLTAQITYPSFLLKPIPYLHEIEERYKQESDRVQKERLWRQRNIRLQFGDSDRATIPLWIWQIGDGLLVAQQNEAYSIFQRQIREKFNGHCIAVANIANGSAGYLPPQAMYETDCYAVKQTPFAAGSLEHLVSTAIDSIGKYIV